METKHTPIKLVKCTCGHPSCDYHGTSDGKFDQGTGYDKQTAEFHVRACNSHEALVKALEIARLQTVGALINDGFTASQANDEVIYIDQALRKARGEA